MAQTVYCNGSPSPAPANSIWACGISSKAGVVCVGSCATGYVGPISATCTAVTGSSTGKWFVSGACTSTNTGLHDTADINWRYLKCTPMPFPVNGACSGTCNAQQNYYGSPSATCQSTLTWAVTAACTKGCPGSAVPGSTSYSFNCPPWTPVGSTCAGACTAGTGTATATCRADSTWGVVSSCSPPPPSSGQDWCTPGVQPAVANCDAHLALMQPHAA